MMNDAPAAMQAVKARRLLNWPLTIVIALSAAAIWLLASTSGLHLLTATLARTGSISFTGVSGSLLGHMEAQTLIMSRPDLRITAHDVRLDWRAAALLKGRLEITTLTARDVSVLSPPSASAYPDNLRLPLAISLQKLNIGILQVFSEQGGASVFSASDISARFDSDGRLHRVQDFDANLDYGKLTASGEIDGIRPFSVRAQADLAGRFTGLDAKEAHVSATMSGDLTKLAINASGSGAGLSGTAQITLTPYAPFPIAALKLTAAGLNPRNFSLKAPTADLTLQADLRANATGRLEGNMTAKNNSPTPLDRNGLPLIAAQVHATLSPDLLQLDKLTLELAKGASISGNITLHRDLSQGLADLAVSRLNPAEIDTRLRAAKLNGRLSISGDKTAQRGALTLSDGTLHLDANLAKAGDTVTLNDLILARGQAALTGQGQLKLGGRRAYTFNGRLQRFDLAAFINTPHSDLNATLDLTGYLMPEATGTLSYMIKGSQLAGQPVSGSGRIEFTGMSRGKGEAELNLGDNRLSARGSLGAATDLLQLEIAAPALKQLGSGFGGTLYAHASLAGRQARPEVTFAAEGRNLIMPGEHQLDSISAVAKLHGEALNMTVNAAKYQTHAKTQVTSLQLDVHGSRSHHLLNAEVHLNKDDTLVLAANGGLTNWQKWQGELTKLTGTGVLPFKLLATAPLTLSPNHVMLNTAELTVAGGKLHINGVDWTPQRWSSQGSFTGIGLRAGLQPELTTLDDKLRLGGEWNIASATQGRLHIARESGDWVLTGKQPLGLRKLEFTALAASGRLSAELTAQGTRLGEWRASVTIPYVKSAAGFSIPDRAPLTGHVRINISDLAWLGPGMSDNLKSGGKLALEADVTGTYGSPGLRGQVRGDDLTIAWLDQGLRLQQGQLVARFDQKSLHIDTLSFIAPHDPKPKDALLSGLNLDVEPGKLSASGILDMSGKNGNIEIIASHLPLSQRPDRWIIASGNGHASLNKNQLALGGAITVDAGLISQSVSNRPQLSDDVVITGRQTAVRQGPHLSVDASLNLGEHFYLRTSGLEARLSGQLSVRDAQGLRVTGSIAARDANFEAYGQKLTVQRGIVNFQGPLYDPGLNILAVRPGLSVEAGVAVTGTARHPAVKLVSTPDVPDVEKLSWIVLGRAPSSTGSDSSSLLAAAGGILGGGAGGITGQLKQALGVDELSLRQNDSTSINDNPLSSQIVTVGKRLSSRAFISYAQGITAVAGVTKLTYTLTPRVNIVTQAGMDNAIDVFYIFSFH